MKQREIVGVSYLVGFNEYWIEVKEKDSGGVLIEKLHRIGDRCDFNQSKVVDSPFYDVISNCLVAN